MKKWYLVILALVGLCSQGRAQAVEGNGEKPVAISPSVEYQVSIESITHKDFRVLAVLHNMAQDTLVFCFPIWAPGSYTIDNYGAYVHDFTATDERGHSLKVLRGDTNTFRIVHAGKEVQLSYLVHDIESLPNSLWFELSDIEPNLAYANGTALFGYPVRFKQAPITVSFHPPEGWKVGVALDSIPGRAFTYRAHDYDELVDAPVQMGTFDIYNFEAAGKPHTVTITSQRPLEDSVESAITSLTQRIVTIETDFFGNVPYDHYLFEHYFYDDADSVSRAKYGPYSGALEHGNSSTYLTPFSSDFDLVQDIGLVVAHEFWHAWSPKRIHVQQLGPFNYQDTVHTKSLWFAEGITEYYANRLLVRKGILDPAEWFTTISREVNGSIGVPQRKSLTEISWDFATLSPGESQVVYTKGPMVALLLDATIRSQTGNAKSLDDAMRYFNDQYGRTGKTFSDEEIIPIMERATGTHLQEFYDHYIDGRDSLPYTQLLPVMGLVRESRKESRLNAGFKYRYSEADQAMIITEITPGGTGESLGLHVGDTLTQMRTQTHSGTGTLAVTIKGAKKERKGPMLVSPMDIYSIRPDPNASPAARAIRADLFSV